MIVAGFGFRAQASADSLIDALSRARGDYNPHALVTLESKVDGLKNIAKAFDLPVVAIDTQTARNQVTQTQSDASASYKGIDSVAEAVALAAAGPNARLLGPRSISADQMATCAIAIGDD